MRGNRPVARTGILALLVSVASGCGGAQNSGVKSADSQVASAETQPAWIVLFDGTGTSAWRGYQKQDFPSGWQIVDGALTRVGLAGDIITRDQFGDSNWSWSGRFRLRATAESCTA